MRDLGGKVLAERDILLQSSAGPRVGECSLWEQEASSESNES
jgi:hypothetical protein